MIVDRLQNDGVPTLGLSSLQREVRDEVLRKIEIKHYESENIFCPICKSTKTDLLGEKDRYGLPYRTVICQNCGLVYVNPRMTQQAFNEFYNKEYRRLYLGRATVDDEYFQVRLMRGKRIYDFISEHSNFGKSSLRVLEIGCSAGHILKYFQDRGHIVEGYDLGEEYVSFGRENYNLNLSVGTLRDVGKRNNYDIIIYSDVMEHVLTPGEEVARIADVCHADTLVFVQVPGLKNLGENYKYDFARYVQNAHTFHFSLRTLTNLFTANGFSLSVGNERVQAIFKIGEGGKIESDYEDGLRYLKRAERMRYLEGFRPRRLRQKVYHTAAALADQCGLGPSFRRFVGQPSKY